MKAEVAKREIESLDYYLQNHTNDYSEESHTAMMMAIQALEQEPCNKCVYSTSDGCQYDDITEAIPPFETSDDAISRKSVLDLVNADWKYEGLEESINSLPAVIPQPKMGQWLSCAEEYGKPVKWVCSSCRHTKSITKNKTEFCPVCGARMGMTDKEIVDKLTELTTGSIDHLDLKDAMDILCEIKRILSRRDRSE